MRALSLLSLFVLFNYHYLSAQCPTADAGANQTICTGGSVQIGPAQPAANAIYSWSPATGLSNPNIPNPIASPSATTTYTLTVSTPPNTNLLVNGDFGQGSLGFTTDPTYSLEPIGSDNSYAGAYTITSNPSYLYHGFCSGGDHSPNNGMLVVDGSTTAYAPCWQETVPVTPNTFYTFSGWYTAISTDYGLAQITVTINGVVVYGPQTAGNLCSWANMSASWNSGSATTATIAISSASTADIGNDFALDDLSFFQSCPPSQANVTVNVDATPSITSAYWQEGSAGLVAMSNLTGQNDICVFWEDGLQLTFNANRGNVAWYIDGVQVTDGTAVSGLAGVVSITNGGQTMSVADGINNFANHYFQVGPLNGSCGTLSPALYVRRVASMFMQGGGYQYTNTIGTISQRNTDYTFNLANFSPSYVNNYRSFLYLWDIPGVNFSSSPFLGRRYIVTVNVPTGYTPAYDPVSGNHYIPGTLTIANSLYGCISNTTYSINFAVPANFPNRVGGGVATGQAAALGVDPDAEAAGSLELFPNPAKDRLSIRPGVSMGQNGYVEIFTSAGVRVRTIRASEVVRGGVLQVNVAGLADGLYFVAVHAGENVIRSKFVVAR